jgi:hypothetical protein
MRSLLVLMPMLVASPALAGEWRLLDARELSMEAYRLDDHRTADFKYADYNDPQGREHWVGGLGLNWDIDLLKHGDDGLYFRNRVHTEGTDAQLRQVGWQYELGIAAANKVEVFWMHHSQHHMDADNDGRRYPLDNWYGARLVFFRRK